MKPDQYYICGNILRRGRKKKNLTVPQLCNILLDLKVNIPIRELDLIEKNYLLVHEKTFEILSNVLDINWLNLEGCYNSYRNFGYFHFPNHYYLCSFLLILRRMDKKWSQEQLRARLAQQGLVITTQEIDMMERSEILISDDELEVFSKILEFDVLNLDVYYDYAPMKSFYTLVDETPEFNYNCPEGGEVNTRFIE